MTPVDAPETRSTFCAGLKRAREERGITLADIAAVTKVNASLLDALERGDVSRWPKGLYRRSFFRDYLGAIGLPAEPHVDTFIQLFPDGEERPAATVRAAEMPAAPAVSAPWTGPLPSAHLRLTFGETTGAGWVAKAAVHPARTSAGIGQRLLAAVADLVVLAAVTFGATSVSGTNPGVTAAIIVGAYYSLATLLFGRSPASALITPWIAARRGQASAIEDHESERVPWRALPKAILERGVSARRASWIATSRFFPARDEQIDRELAEVRRRRIEQANQTVDEMELMG